MDEEVRCNQEVDCDDKSDEEGCGKITISLIFFKDRFRISAKVFHFLINGNVYSILFQITNVLQITKPNARKLEDVLTMTTCAMVN